MASLVNIKVIIDCHDRDWFSGPPISNTTGRCVKGPPNRVGIAIFIFDFNRKVLGSVSMVIMDDGATRETVATLSSLADAEGREIHATLRNPGKFEQA
jgi:hypothetical protein